MVQGWETCVRRLLILLPQKERALAPHNSTLGAEDNHKLMGIKVGFGPFQHLCLRPAALCVVTC